MRSSPLPRWLAASICVGTLFLVACAESVPTSPDGARVQLLLGSDVATERTDPVEIVSAEVEGDDLRLQLRFGGGCADHDFALVHSGDFRESHPVQTTLSLMHDAHGDNCLALLGREISFDLTPVRTAYRAAYSAHGVVVIHLRAPAASSVAHTVRYEF